MLNAPTANIITCKEPESPAVFFYLLIEVQSQFRRKVATEHKQLRG